MSNIHSSLSPSRVSVQWHDSSVSSFYPGKAHSIVCPQCFTCDMILLNLFSWLCWFMVVSRKIVLETSQLSPWHTVSGVSELQYLQLCRFSYSVAYGMLVSQSEIEPSSLTLQGGCLTIGPPGKAPGHSLSACFYTLYQKDTLFDGIISPFRVAKIWHASRTSLSTLVKYNQGFINMQCHSMHFFTDYSLNTSNRLLSSTVSVKWHLKLFLMHPGSNTSSCLYASSVSLLWHAFRVSLSSPGQTYSVAYHYPHSKEEFQLHLGPPQLI